MSDYIKIVDYAAKDALLTGNPAKLVKGSEIGADFDAVAVAVATKADEDGATLVNVDINSGTIDGTTIGATTPAAATVTSLTDSGNLAFTGTGNRITGDFSSGTVANRVIFQTSTANTTTSVGFIPSGTGTTAELEMANNSGMAIARANTLIGVSATESYIKSGIRNSGTYLPMTFYTGGSERMRIDASGNVGIADATPSSRGRFSVGTPNSIGFGAIANSVGNGGGSQWASFYGTAKVGYFDIQLTDGTVGSEKSQAAIGVMVNGTLIKPLVIDQNGNIQQVTPAGLGYGTGAGGTASQGTSRTTTVTFATAKPTGAITMFTAAGSATAATFTVSNPAVAATDTVVLSVKSATNKYAMVASAVAAGSFDITFWAVTGTASDAPVINFCVLKGATS